MMPQLGANFIPYCTDGTGWEKSGQTIYGYYVNPSKTWLIVEEEHLSSATKLFQEEGVQITLQGRRHLGATLGSRSFTESYINSKVTDWIKEVLQLPLASLMQLMVPLHMALLGDGPILPEQFLISLTCLSTGRYHSSPIHTCFDWQMCPQWYRKRPPIFTNMFRWAWHLQSLCCLRSSLPNFPAYYGSSCLSNHSRVQWNPYSAICDQELAKSKAKSDWRQEEFIFAESLYPLLSQDLQRAVDIAKERGDSSWLTTLPIKEHGFSLHKGAFRDALCVRYGWRPSRLAAEYVCGKNFTVDHALSCPHGGLPALRRNEMRYLTAQLMSETCPNVSTEPDLQPLWWITHIPNLQQTRWSSPWCQSSGETDTKVHFLM